MHFFPNKFKSLPAKFRKCFWYNCEDAYFDRKCVNAALNNSAYSILNISRINRGH